MASGTASAAKLQDLLYTYDPVGNVVEVDDNADTAPIFSGTTPVRGDGFYRYDSIYRLIYAQGREHPGQQQPTGTFEIANSQIPHPNDLQALVQYFEKYTYDQVGNIQKIAHTPIAAGPTWTRSYQYAANSNRLMGTSAPGDPDGTFSDTYTYSGNGAMTHMSSLQVIEWDYADRMRHANQGSGGGDVFFTYDGTGQRVRKVFQPTTSTTLTERIYVGGWETFRSRAGGTITSAITVERQTLHVMDDKRRIAMVETTISGTGPAGSLWRFQLSNLIDSAVMELDAQGHVITYEEYHPFGSTAFRSSDSSSEVSPKRYRYTGKEKDEETGLYYHGARYYVPWLGRWTAADPAATIDGLNLFRYARNSPAVMVDSTGHQAAPAVAPDPAAVEAAKTAVERAAARWGSAEVIEGGAGAAEVAAPASASPLAAEIAASGWGLAFVAATYLAVKNYAQRAGSIGRYGNPFGVSADSAFPVQNYLREHPQVRPPRTEPGPSAPPVAPPTPIPSVPLPVPPPSLPERAPIRTSAQGARHVDRKAEPDRGAESHGAPRAATKADQKKKQDPRAFVVRLQAQGGGTEQSVVLAGPLPVSAAAGLGGLETLKTKLAPKELELRQRLFEQAARFISNAPAGGGVGPPGRSFALPRSNIRVDVEILRGINFVR